MKVAYDARSVTLPVYESAKPAAPVCQPPGMAALFDEEAATLELSENAARPWEKQDWKWKYDVKEASRSSQQAAARRLMGPRDDSGRLTRRLVSSSSQDEVRSLVSEAYHNLSELYQSAMGGGPESAKAWAAIKRLNKLIKRAYRKISDLNREDTLRVRKRRAEKRQEEARAKQIKTELCRRIQERKTREKGYLRDAERKNELERQIGPDLSPAALEAKFLALADSMAQVTAPPPVSAAAESAGCADMGGEAAAGPVVEAAAPTE